MHESEHKPTKTMRTLTKAEAIERAEEYATPLNQLISPSDVCDGADSWAEIGEETLNREIHRSIDVIMGELHYGHSSLKGVMYERAMKHHIDNMMRVPLDDLSLSRTEAIGSMYWPYDMSEGDITVELYEQYETLKDLPSEDYQEAYSNVSEGLKEGMKPNTGDM